MMSTIAVLLIISGFLLILVGVVILAWGAVQLWRQMGVRARAGARSAGRARRQSGRPDQVDRGHHQDPAMAAGGAGRRSAALAWFPSRQAKFVLRFVWELVNLSSQFYGIEGAERLYWRSSRLA